MAEKSIIFIDINEGTRQCGGYVKIYEKIYGLESSDTGKRNIVFFDGGKIKEAVEAGTERDEDLIKKRFGLLGDKGLTLEKLAQNFGITSQGVRLRIEETIERLADPTKTSGIKPVFQEQEIDTHEFTPEEKKRINVLLNKIEECLNDSNNFSFAELKKMFVELVWIKEVRAEKERREEADVTLEELGPILAYNPAYNLLGRKEFYTLSRIIEAVQTGKIRVNTEWWGEQRVQAVREMIIKICRIIDCNPENVLNTNGNYILHNSNEVAKTFAKFRNAGIDTVEKSEALRVLTNETVQYIFSMSDQELLQFAQRVISGDEKDEGIHNISSEEIKAIKIMGVKGIRAVKNGILNEKALVVEKNDGEATKSSKTKSTDGSPGIETEEVKEDLTLEELKPILSYLPAYNSLKKLGLTSLSDIIRAVQTGEISMSTKGWGTERVKAVKNMIRRVYQIAYGNSADIFEDDSYFLRTDPKQVVSSFMRIRNGRIDPEAEKESLIQKLIDIRNKLDDESRKTGETAIKARALCEKFERISGKGNEVGPERKI